MTLEPEDLDTPRGAMLLATQVRALESDLMTLLGLMRDMLAQLEREANRLERLAQRPGEVFRQAGLD